MRRKRLISLHVLVLLLILLACPHTTLFAQADDPQGAIASLQRMRAEEEAKRTITLEKLERSVDVDCMTNLADAVQSILDQVGLEAVYDNNPLRDFGIDIELEPGELVISGVPARTALRLILEDCGLSWDIRSGRIFITTIDQAYEYLSTRVYNVTDRIVSLESGRLLCSEDDMIDIITEVIKPESWDSWGGPGTVNCVTVNRRMLMSVRQTHFVLEEIEQLLAELRRLDVPASERPDPSWLAEDVRIMECLERPLEKSYEDATLVDVVNDMRLAARTHILFQKNPLRDFGIDPETEPIDRDCLTMSVGEALDFILPDIGLTHVLRDGILLITTIDQSREILSTRIYDVTNLMGGPQSANAILDLATEIVEPDSWDTWGGPGTLQLVEQEHGWFLVVRQTWKIHRELEQFLSDIEMRALGEDPLEDPQWQALLDQVETERMERMQRAEEIREQAREAEESAESQPEQGAGPNPFESANPPSPPSTDPFQALPPSGPDPFESSPPAPNLPTPSPAGSNPFGATDPFGGTPSPTPDNASFF